MAQFNSSIHAQLSEVLASGEESDITLIVGKVGNQVVIQAHSFVLKIRTPVFKAMLSQSWRNGNEIQLPHDDPKLFKKFLQGLYGATLPEGIQDALSLLALADKYDARDLKDAWEVYVMKNMGLCDVIQVYDHSILYGSKMFHEFVYSTVLVNYEQIIKTDYFYEIDREFLIRIISDDNLKVNTESMVYFSVLRWIRYHLNKDKLKHKENMNPEMDLVKSMIPYIRFPLLSVVFLCDIVQKDNVLTAAELLQIISYISLRSYSDSTQRKKKLKFCAKPRTKNPMFPATPIFCEGIEESDQDTDLSTPHLRILLHKSNRPIPDLRRMH